MKTNCDATTSAMRQANPSGTESKKNSNLRIVFQIVLLGMLLSSCTVNQPKLHYTYLPESYETTSGLTFDQNGRYPQLRFKLLNDNPGQNKNVIRLWQNGAFRQMIQKEHSYITVQMHHITALMHGLYRLFDIYFLADTSEAHRDFQRWIEIIPAQDRCHPLSNNELQFMLSTGADNSFPRILLTMIVITSHELLLRKGATPVYPKIISPYLRRHFQLAELKPISKANLFSEKSITPTQLKTVNGFVFCRKGKRLF